MKRRLWLFPGYLGTGHVYRPLGLINVARPKVGLVRDVSGASLRCGGVVCAPERAQFTGLQAICSENAAVNEQFGPAVVKCGVLGARSRGVEHKRAFACWRIMERLAGSARRCACGADAEVLESFCCWAHGAGVAAGKGCARSIFVRAGRRGRGCLCGRAAWYELLD